MGRLNPRVRLWLLAEGLPLDFTARDANDELPRMPAAHALRGLPWSIAYSEWITAQWRAWAASLGYTRRRDGHTPEELAILEGRHTHAEFDAWLETTVGETIAAAVRS